MFKVAGKLVLFINIIILVILGISSFIFLFTDYLSVLPTYSLVISFIAIAVCFLFAIYCFILLKKSKSTLPLLSLNTILFGFGIFYMILLILGKNIEIYYSFCVVLLVCSIISFFSIYWTRKGE